MSSDASAAFAASGKVPAGRPDLPLLPDFIVIGAMKCGTTSLYHYLAQHPEIGMSRDKETDIFVTDGRLAGALAGRVQQFEPGHRLLGEVSPNYTKRRDIPGVPERIAAVRPDARLVYIVRDPVERAVAQFRHAYIRGELDTEPEHLPGTHDYEHVLDASRYARQLAAFRDHFPPDALRVVDFDVLRDDPQAVLDAVLAHIGAAPMEVAPLPPSNDSRHLSRVPAPLLRFARSPRGRALARSFGAGTRQRIRAALALGPRRSPPAFPEALIARMQEDLAQDAAAFRRMTGAPYASWTV
jgi:hypothetical protein